MRKLNLAGLSYDRDGILNALERTNAVEVKLHAEAEGTSPLPACGEELREYLGSLEAALSLLVAEADNYAKEHKLKTEFQDGFNVSYAEFSAAKERKEEADALVAKVNALADERNACLAENAKLSRTLAQAKPYAAAELPFDEYKDSLHIKTRLGTVAPAAWENLKTELDALSLVAYDAVVSGDAVLVTVSAHKSVFAEAEGLLSGAGFSPCPFMGHMTGAELVSSLKEQSRSLLRRAREIEEEFYALSSEIKPLKIYCDYIGFELEKAELSEKLRGTERTFFLEAFVPAEQEETVKSALENVSGALWYEFSDPSDDEEIPTLCKNNAVVSNFEMITNMYSTPNARELDPNTVMSFFYSLFIGFIMGDIGYGLLMLFGGGALYFKSKQGGLKSLSGVFAVGGIFAIIWGFLFNSLFGIRILPFTVMPDAQTDMYTFIGIGIPSVLVISLLLGVVQLMAGYACKMAQYVRRGKLLDGVFDGGVWVVFSLGVLLALVGLVEEFGLPFLSTAGGIIAGAALVVAVLTAGRHEKFLGKLSKGFGAAYGLINYFTDVLSYIRLYGLMLTGAVIAQVVSDYSIQFMTSGSALIILGPLLMVVGHVFNLAIGLLGAYIHTARLQYVEFFGRFYEGEGAMFTPLGSQKKYISLERTPL